jgi:steroid delta-isomerase-like uncharacterized protein
MGQATDTMRRKIAAFNARDMDKTIGLYSADVEMTVPGASLRGRDQVATYFYAFWEAFPDLRLTVTREVEEGSGVFVEATATGTHTGTLHTPGGDVPPTGVRVDLPFSELFDVKEGQIDVNHLYFDQLGFLEQLGLAPAPAHV